MMVVWKLLIRGSRDNYSENIMTNEERERERKRSGTRRSITVRTCIPWKKRRVLLQIYINNSFTKIRFKKNTKDGIRQTESNAVLKTATKGLFYNTILVFTWVKLSSASDSSLNRYIVLASDLSLRWQNIGQHIPTMVLGGLKSSKSTEVVSRIYFIGC